MQKARKEGCPWNEKVGPLCQHSLLPDEDIWQLAEMLIAYAVQVVLAAARGEHMDLLKVFMSFPTRNSEKSKRDVECSGCMKTGTESCHM